MPNERENFYQPLKMTEYDIAGNVLRAYYDMDNKLVFVLDMLIDGTKPNVLLVINPVGNRKWDDILMNDYGVDLETVRPKYDNKYQKLDIEYTGLAAYDALIGAYNAGVDLSDAMANLNAFRAAASGRAAMERLAAAELTAERARETINRAEDTVGQLQSKLKTLRAKLTAQRREIGKEPTKQSAAKILRTESQIEATGDKLNRAKKRQSNAQKRLAAAVDDADMARDILDALGTDGANVPAMPMPTDVMAVKSAPVPMENAPKFTEIVPYEEDVDDEDEIYDEPQETDMADDEVKPLFDEDPNILDENIAFKPIDFSADVPAPVMPVGAPEKSDANAIEPLSFTPPIIEEEEEETVVEPVPVLNTLTSVDAPSAEIDSELMATIEPAGVPEPVVQPEMPVAPVAPAPQPMPEIAPAPIDSGFRPVSPIAAEPVTELSDGGSRAKPTVLYYVMLIALIVLSIFTLWVYQKSANDNLPELGANSSEPAVATVVEEVSEPGAPSPFIEEVNAAMTDPGADIDVMPLPVEVVMEEFTVAEPVDEPVVVDVVEEPVAVVEEPQEIQEMVEVPVMDVVEPEIVADEVVETEPESPFVSDEVVESVVVNPVPDVVVNKPEYSVSPQEKPVVAIPEYDVAVEPVVESAPVVVEYNDEPEYYQASEPVVQQPVYYDEYVAEPAPSGGCAGGGMPDSNGCCPGENFMDAGDGQYYCCDEATGDCFDPMQ